MLTIKMLRVGSRIELVTARELYIRMNHDQLLLVLSPDDRLYMVGKGSDWRAAVEMQTGTRPPSGDEKALGMTQMDMDVAALEEAFGHDHDPKFMHQWGDPDKREG